MKFKIPNTFKDGFAAGVLFSALLALAVFLIGVSI